MPHNTSNKVLQKFGVPQSVMWMNERKFIEQGYPKFQDWIANGDTNNEDRGWYLSERWAPEMIHKGGLVLLSGSPTGGGGSYLGMKIELTPNTKPAISDIEKSVLMLETWTGQAPIYEHLNNINDNEYFTITVVYDKDPGQGIVLPINGTAKDNLVNNLDNQPLDLTDMTMYNAAPLYQTQVSYDTDDKPIYGESTIVGYTHKITLKKSSALLYSDHTHYCDYLVVFLKDNTNGAIIEHMYISYDNVIPDDSSNKTAL